MKELEKISERLISWIGTPLSIVVHTFFFALMFFLKFMGFDMEKILLVLTTAVSLEAIYLSIFIQMSVNKTKESLAIVEKDIDDIQEDVDDIQEDVEELNEEDEDDEIVKTIKDIEAKLVVLHKEILEIKDKNK